MVKELVVYPDDRILACSNVRSFKEDLDRLLEDIEDTMEANNLKALSAIQIARPFNVAVIKQKDGSYLELINPRILKKEGTFESIEETSYFPNIKIKVPRYKKIKLIYEDREGKLHSIDVEDEWLSSTIQRKLDFLFGGTPLDKVDKNYREKILNSLAKEGFVAPEVCPTFSKKDYIKSFNDKILFLMGLSLFTPLFVKFFDWSKESVEKIYTFDKFAFPLVWILMIIYFVYAQFEAKKYRQCSSCQIGNQIGIILKRIGLSIIFAIGAFIVFEKIL